MTIKIVAQNLTSEVTEKLISLCNTLILEKGNYGEFTSSDSKFTTTLHLRELYPEIRDMMTLIKQNITEFYCGQTEMEINETFGLSEINVTDSEEKTETETVFESETEIEVKTENASESETNTATKDDATAETKTTTTTDFNTEVEATNITETEVESKVNAETAIESEEKPEAVIDEKQAVLLLFEDVNGKKSPKEISDEVTEHLHLKDHFYKKSFYNISSMIEAYAKAPIKPSSLTGLQKLVHFNLYYQTYTKLNSITKQVFMEKYNIEISFLQCLFYVCEKLANDSDDNEYVEEVVLIPPEKPPDSESTIEPKKSFANLCTFIESLDSHMTLADKINKLVNFMGLQEFEKHNRNTVERLFYSIFSYKETDLNMLFNSDPSLKKISTAEGSIMVIKRFIGKFFSKTVSEDFVIEFFNNLLNNYSEYFTTIKSSPCSKPRVAKKVSKTKAYQEHGELRSFPKNEEFDTFIRKNVKFQRFSKLKKIHKILKYMGINNLPKDNSKIIYKICCDLTIINFRSSLYFEKLCTPEDTKIIETFINDFAKQLKPDANFITLTDFLNDLKNLP